MQNIREFTTLQLCWKHLKQNGTCNDKNKFPAISNHNGSAAAQYFNITAKIKNVVQVVPIIVHTAQLSKQRSVRIFADT